MLTIDDVLEYEPSIFDYGASAESFESKIELTKQDIIRMLRIRWLPQSGISTTEFDPSRLDESQLTRAAVYHVLSYYILPQMTKFDSDPDNFTVMMDYYKSRFHEEFELVLADGVNYDANNDSIYSEEEKTKINPLRLVR
jgi:hypothetical protein